jgi:hypothetical protein
MLATARGYRPELRALLMRRDIFDVHAALSAVTEPSPAAENPPIGLTTEEPVLYRHLRSLGRGRLEQQFLQADQVSDTLATRGSGS